MGRINNNRGIGREMHSKGHYSMLLRDYTQHKRIFILKLSRFSNSGKRSNIALDYRLLYYQMYRSL